MVDVHNSAPVIHYAWARCCTECDLFVIKSVSFGCGYWFVVTDGVK